MSRSYSPMQLVRFNGSPVHAGTAAGAGSITVKPEGAYVLQCSTDIQVVTSPGYTSSDPGGTKFTVKGGTDWYFSPSPGHTKLWVTGACNVFELE